MYSKKYRCSKIDSKRDNPYHDAIVGSVCYLAYLNIGERGWFLYEAHDWYGFSSAHRIHTSVIKNVQYINSNQVVVTTENTKYVFDLIVSGDDNE